MKYISLLNEQNLRWAYHLCLIMSSRSRLHGARSLSSPNLCFAPPGHASTKLPWSFGAGYKRIASASAYHFLYYFMHARVEAKDGVGDGGREHANTFLAYGKSA